MDDLTIRLECLKLACQAGAPAEKAIEVAEDFYRFTNSQIPASGHPQPSADS